MTSNFSTGRNGFIGWIQPHRLRSSGSGGQQPNRTFLNLRLLPPRRHLLWRRHRPESICLILSPLPKALRLRHDAPPRPYLEPMTTVHGTSKRNVPKRSQRLSLVAVPPPAPRSAL